MAALVCSTRKLRRLLVRADWLGAGTNVKYVSHSLLSLLFSSQYTVVTERELNNNNKLVANQPIGVEALWSSG